MLVSFTGHFPDVKCGLESRLSMIHACTGFISNLAISMISVFFMTFLFFYLIEHKPRDNSARSIILWPNIGISGRSSSYNWPVIILNEKGVCRYNLTEKFLQILIEPCHCENIENMHLLSVFSLFVPSYNTVYVHNCEKVSGPGWSVAR